jgi:hexosaminidase
MQALCLLSLGILFCATRIGAQGQAQSQEPAQTALNLMPYPAQVEMGSGFFRIDPSISIVQDTKGHQEVRLDRAVQRFAQQLAERTGMPGNFLNHPMAGRPGFLILTQHAGKDVQELGEDESYVLEVKSDGVTLTAPTPLGTMHGLQTLLQLVQVTPDGFVLPAVTIRDLPRFPWRGLMIDSGRHFIPLDVLKRNVDGLEAVKMNVLHWHLSENQGFRVESKKFPKLHELGSDRLFYTQDEVRDLIAYARDRGIRVVPEFDMPGHSTAWFVGYPELASGPGPYEIERRWGVFPLTRKPTSFSTNSSVK